jgi:hypothetical protein
MVALVAALILCAGSARAADLCLELDWFYVCSGESGASPALRGFSTDSVPCQKLDPDRCLSLDGQTWKISSSATDPDVNTGPIQDDSLYLWLTCADRFDGFLNALMYFYGDMQVESIDLIPPEFVFEWWPGDYAFFSAPDCADPRVEPILVARLTVDVPTAVREPVTPDDFSWGRTKALYRP